MLYKKVSSNIISITMMTREHETWIHWSKIVSVQDLEVFLVESNSPLAVKGLKAKKLLTGKIWSDHQRYDIRTSYSQIPCWFFPWKLLTDSLPIFSMKVTHRFTADFFHESYSHIYCWFFPWKLLRFTADFFHESYSQIHCWSFPWMQLLVCQQVSWFSSVGQCL